MWHKIAPRLAERFSVVATDLRGYGDSGKPASDGDLSVYCKRTTAHDQVEVMTELGFESFHLVGHDRGARVGHRLALDHPERVMTFTSLDVVASQAAFDAMDRDLAYSWFHWHLMRQPAPLPETLIGNSAKSTWTSCWTSGRLWRVRSPKRRIESICAASATRKRSVQPAWTTARSCLI